MKVSVFGLGYVGVVTSACFARDGHTVVGVDVNADKVSMVNEGRSPIVELGLSELLADMISAKRLMATTSVDEAVAATTVSLVCVGSPSAPDGSTDLRYVYNVCEQIGAAVAKKQSSHTVIIRSTVPPGTTEQCRNIITTAANGVEVHCAFNPEFLREGSAIHDYQAAPFTVIGTDDPVAEQTIRSLYALVETQVVQTEIRVAEMIKYTCNAWHAVKISFANEIGRIAKTKGVDGRKVMNVVVQDTKLNISPTYMRPGFAYGGSCLPKDVRSLLHLARTGNTEVPLLASLSITNDYHINRALQMIIDSNKRAVGFLGLAFKSGTDDLRESPAVELAERLLGKGYLLKIYDPAVQEAKIIGANKQYIESKLPHLTSLLVSDYQDILEHSQVLVITHAGREFLHIIEKAARDVMIIDLAGIVKTEEPEGNYEGIAW
jgi:GDP-mannose 6-dehydrogenase